jgi:hypothetical protein
MLRPQAMNRPMSKPIHPLEISSLIQLREAVIASEAKHPLSPRARKDGLLRFARNDGQSRPALSIQNNSQQIAPASE